MGDLNKSKNEMYKESGATVGRIVGGRAEGTTFGRRVVATVGRGVGMTTRPRMGFRQPG